MDQRQEIRLINANEFIKVIASCGRHFFNSNNESENNFVSFFEMGIGGKVFFTDSYTRKRIYVNSNVMWDGFSNGGSLQSLIYSLKEFILRGGALNLQQFSVDRSPWGYGDEMAIVYQAAIDLGISHKNFRPLRYFHIQLLKLEKLIYMTDKKLSEIVDRKKSGLCSECSLWQISYPDRVCMFASWGGFSGNAFFPIKEINGSDFIDNDIDNFAGYYLEQRIDLAKHCVKYIRNNLIQ